MKMFITIIMLVIISMPVLAQQNALSTGELEILNLIGSEMKRLEGEYDFNNCEIVDKFSRMYYIDANVIDDEELENFDINWKLPHLLYVHYIIEGNKPGQLEVVIREGNYVYDGNGNKYVADDYLQTIELWGITELK